MSDDEPDADRDGERPDDEAERHQEELNDAVEAGGCTEIWEKLSKSRENDDPSGLTECNSD